MSFKEHDRVVMKNYVDFIIFEVIGNHGSGHYTIVPIQGGSIASVSEEKITVWVPCSCTDDEQCDIGKQLLTAAFKAEREYHYSITRRKPRHERFLAWKKFKNLEAEFWYHLGEV